MLVTIAERVPLGLLDRNLSRLRKIRAKDSRERLISLSRREMIYNLLFFQEMSKVTTLLMIGF